MGFAAGGLNEAVADDETGILVPPGDVQALGVAISRLLDDTKLRAKLGEAGRQRMQKEFSIATMAAKHVELYGSLIDA